MNHRILAAQLLSLGRFLQDRILPELLRKFRQHHIILPYMETAVMACYRWGVLLNPDLAEAHYKLGRLFQKQQKWQEAATAFEQAIKSDYCQRAEAYCNLGRVLFGLKQLEESISALRQAIELEPEQHWHYRFLGDVLTEKSELHEAIENYQLASQKKIKQTHPHVSIKSQKEQHFSAPNFLVIGQAKCGTSSLYSYLIQHPQILPAIEKEINFWNIQFDKGLDWYLAHFPTIPSEQSLITGEATPAYLDSWKAPVSLFQEFPSMKLIILLRNPIDRAISHYYMKVRHDRESSSLQKAMLSELESSIRSSNIDSYNSSCDNLYLNKGKYIKNIRKWLEIFPKNQILIVRSEDLFADPTTTVNQIFQFLGIEPYQLKEYKKKNSGNYSPIPQSMRRTLNDYFRPFNQQLEEYLDREFKWNSE